MKAFFVAYTLPILAILYLVGAVGILYFPELGIIRLSALQLAVSCTLLLLPLNRKIWTGKLLLIFVLGLLIEIIGVQTSIPFGTYHYGTNLGPKLFEVPIIIGVNWFLVAYTSQQLVSLFTQSYWVKLFAGSLVMLLLDLLIEPVAGSLDFWHWAAPAIPIENYWSWFAFGVICQFVLLYKNREQSPHRNAVYLYFIQLVFFLLFHLIPMPS